MIKRSALMGLILLSGSALAEVKGYRHLYNPQTNTVIDLLHDGHTAQKDLSLQDLTRLSFNEIKAQLFQTEQRMLDAFAVLNAQAPGMVDIIWEDSSRRSSDGSMSWSPEDTALLRLSKELVKDQFPHLNLIQSDVSRDRLRVLYDMADDMVDELDGISLGDPLPISDHEIASIIANYGYQTYQAFEQLRKQTIDRLADRYLDDYLNGRRHKSFDHKIFHAVCDVEMLRNILSSRKPHIILFAGGWHSHNIYKFLTRQAGFKEVGTPYEEINGEIPAKCLDLLDANFRTTPWQPTGMGSSYYYGEYSDTEYDDPSASPEWESVWEYYE